MEITYAEVVHASHKVKKTAESIKSELDDLNRRVKRVVESWDGETQRAFYDRQRDWDQRVNSMHETLLSISRKLESATEGYKGVDHGNARRF
ncbi:WXG100 family type VII secretion target [Streptomyces niger]|uniref:WXG100 family type VII secretion target n=1 Tax=Streptomyces niger TaxID=66373 RepID=UPI000699F113|nr:WXG100 family type VII secretion target [Streptomyces niger]